MHVVQDLVVVLRLGGPDIDELPLQICAPGKKFVAAWAAEGHRRIASCRRWGSQQVRPSRALSDAAAPLAARMQVRVVLSATT